MSDPVTCPACKSEIAADGGAVVRRSPALADLEKTAQLLPKLEKQVARLEKQLQRAERELKRARKTSPSPLSTPAAPPAAEPEPVPQTGPEPQPEKRRGLRGWLLD